MHSFVQSDILAFQRFGGQARSSVSRPAFVFRLTPFQRAVQRNNLMGCHAVTDMANQTANS